MKSHDNKEVEVKYYIGFDFSRPSSLKDLMGMAERKNPGWVAMPLRSYEKERHNKEARTYRVTIFKWESKHAKNS